MTEHRWTDTDNELAELYGITDEMPACSCGAVLPANYTCESCGEGNFQIGCLQCGEHIFIEHDEMMFCSFCHTEQGKEKE